MISSTGGGKGILEKCILRTWPSASFPWIEGNTWLVEQYRFTLEAYSWENTGRRGRPDRIRHRIGQRELRKRLGSSRENGALSCRKCTFSNSVSDERALILPGRQLNNEKAMPERGGTTGHKKTALRRSLPDGGERNDH